MIKCVVCECASVLSYEVPGQRPPLTCPNCGRDTRRYISMRQDDLRVKRMVETYRKQFRQNPPDATEDPAREPAGVRAVEQTDEQIGTMAVEAVDISLLEQTGKQPDASGREPAGMEAGGLVQERTGGQTAGTATPAPDHTVDSLAHDSAFAQAAPKRTGYVLVSEDGSYRIRIPEQGGVIGRTGIGAHELAHNGRVSRQHLKVTPSRRAKGLLIEDISSNGTCLDGRQILPGQVEFAVIGSEIRLSREVLILREDV